jgi:hypothetical protein
MGSAKLRSRDPSTFARDDDLERFAWERTFSYLSSMANETAIVDAEDLKKRAETLRRFL